MKKMFSFLALMSLMVLLNISPIKSTSTEPFIIEDQTLTKIPTKAVAKKLTILVYMSADNDLEFFSRRNIAQLAAIGSNEYVSILIHLDTKTADGKKITKLYYVEKNKLIVLSSGPGMDSGDPETLIHFAKTALSQFPGEEVAIILWNHGIGIIDIDRPRSINPSVLFSFNPLANIIELDRSIPFLAFVENIKYDPRGVCFDDTTGNYLTNQKLEYALKTISQDILGKKISLIGFDACLMSMVEVANIAKDYANYMVGSEEVELGTGWNYQLAFASLTQPLNNIAQLACQIVDSYEKTYARITNDYTQSAVDLSGLQLLEENINKVSLILIEFLQKEKGQSVYEAIKTSRHRLLCTHFDEPSYIDLGHFYKNLLANSSKFICNNPSDTNRLKKELTRLIAEGLLLIQQIVLCNTVGKNLSKATGLSIYFPEYALHNSYKKTKFAITNAWYKFLLFYLQKNG